MAHQKPLVSFDYAIKHLIKDKKDFTIVEGMKEKATEIAKNIRASSEGWEVQ